MLQRSLSEPGFPRQVSQPRHVSVTPTITLLNHGKQRRCRVSGLSKVLKKFLRPILGRKSSGGERKHVPDPRNPLSWKTFSRSLSPRSVLCLCVFNLCEAAAEKFSDKGGKRWSKENGFRRLSVSEAEKILKNRVFRS
ncbi:hypothetical protein D0Y65_005986 [Glycine soja]|uniref:Uncharacterized protein n=1 Tax=Glycine soja TaxID=3848 RepID=A0A445L7B7_GLYSO|nr:hypothetical protein D0Y65_005986 [Glycine soja]